MKRLLAGLAMGLVAVIVLKSRKRREEGRGLRRQDGRWGSRSERLRGRETASRQPELDECAGTAAVAAATAPSRDGEAGRRQQPQPPKEKSEEEMLNSATRQQLLSVYGIGPVLADRIIQNRPYAAAYDVVRQGIIPESIFVQLRKQLLGQCSA